MSRSPREAPLSLRWRIGVFILGAVLFAIFIYSAGPAELLAHLRQAGWILVPVCLLWIPIFLCRTAAWQLTMGGSPGRTPPVWRTFFIAITTFGINIITPFVQAGGELLRIKAITPWMGAQRATGSTVTYYMLHALSNMLMWLAGLIAALLFIDMPRAWVVSFVGALVVIVALFVFVMSRHQQGVVAPLVALLSMLPVAGKKLAARLEAHRKPIEELDHVVTAFYRGSPWRFFLALGIDTLGRVITLGEYWLVAHGVGVVMSPAQALIVGSLGGLIVNVIFFVPLEAGVKEGGFFLAFQLVGLDPALGVFAALVQRLREFTWVAIGLLVIPLAGGDETEAE